MKAEIIEHIQFLEKAYQQSSLPDMPNQAKIEQVLVEIRTHLYGWYKY